MLTALSNEEAFVVEIGDLPPIKAVQTGSAGIGNWVVFVCCGFASDEAAKKAGQSFKDMLSVVGAINSFGIEVGFDRQSPQYSKVVHEAVKKQSGKALQGEVHGLMTFEEGSLAIVGASGSMITTRSAQDFSKCICELPQGSTSLNERQRISAALLNDSFFVPNTEAQFVLRISAIEALCDRSLPKSLAKAHNETIASLLGIDDAESFRNLYVLRSALVHNGAGRGELQSASTTALDLAKRLLLASFDQ